MEQNKYKCLCCKKIVKRKDNRPCIKSYCESLNKYTKLILIKKTMKLPTKIKLSLASKRDKKPTIKSKDLGYTSEKILLELKDKFLVMAVTFHISRDKKTYYADYWNWRLPKVGKPIHMELINSKPLK